MGYDPKTMVERGVLWAEDQDPFGHVMQSQYTHFLGTTFHRTMESYDEFLSEQEYHDMINAKTITPVVRDSRLVIRRPVKYPDTVSTNGCFPVTNRFTKN
jgi:acyl-CoA thioesterase FadM